MAKNKEFLLKQILKSGVSQLVFKSGFNKVDSKGVPYFERTDYVIEDTGDWGGLFFLYSNTIKLKRFSISALAHEKGHRDNLFKYDINSIPMKLNENFKAHCHDEISANIKALLQLRYEFMEKNLWEKGFTVYPKHLDFDFYFDALKKGEITTNHASVEEFDKEMKFIAQGVKKMWKTHLLKLYEERHLDCVGIYFDSSDYKDIANEQSMYEMYRSAVYNIGGIDFSEYIDDEGLDVQNLQYADDLVKLGYNRETVDSFIYGDEENLKGDYEEIIENDDGEREFDFNNDMYLKLWDAARPSRCAPSYPIESKVKYSEIINFNSDILKEERDKLVRMSQNERNIKVLRTKLKRVVKNSLALELAVCGLMNIGSNHIVKQNNQKRALSEIPETEVFGNSNGQYSQINAIDEQTVVLSDEELRTLSEKINAHKEYMRQSGYKVTYDMAVSEQKTKTVDVLEDLLRDIAEEDAKKQNGNGQGKQSGNKKSTSEETIATLEQMLKDMGIEH